VKARLAVALVLVAAGCGAFDHGPYRVELTDSYVGRTGRLIQIGLSDCNVASDVDVAATDDEVRVAAEVDERIDGDCYSPIVIRLDEPLGDRGLVDGVADEGLDPVPCGKLGRDACAHIVELADEDGTWPRG
jgi:hypothetical protein